MSAPVTVGAVILTMGNRREELQRALGSLVSQQGVELDAVVVVNGSDPVEVPEGVRVHRLGDNLGIPAGRNAGVAQVSGEYIFFLDDDSWLLSDTFLSDAIGMLRADPTLGMIQPRIIDPDRRGEEPRRWIPRLRKGDPARSSEVLPAPFAPTTVTISPLSTCRSSPCSTSIRP